MRGFSLQKIKAGLRAGYQLWGSSSEKADIHRKNNYCVETCSERKTNFHLSRGVAPTKLPL
jgi:hypothetical protein